MTLFSRREVLVLAAALATSLGQAEDQSWAEGQNYFKIEPPPSMPPQQPGVVTITEVFSYGCPACNGFLPYMRALAQKLPPKVVLDYVPASWLPAEDWPVFQRAYFTAKALGVAAKAHEAVFAAVWNNGELTTIDATTRRPKTPLPSMEDVARFYQRATGVPAAQFLETSRSFFVDAEIKRADALILALHAESTPTLVVNGKYRLDSRSAGGPQQAIDLALWLAQQEQRR